MPQEIDEVKEFFAKNHIILSDFWLENCIEWFHKETGHIPYTKNELHTKIYEQWLLLDLRDVEVRQLPQNINNEKKIVIKKTFSLQLMSVVDISKPKLKQLQKIKNLNTLTRDLDDGEEHRSEAQRVLQLVLTDGVQEIKAIEYKPVPVLSINLTPGVKIKINGPVIVRRGQMMLEQQNVKVLGGEVEEILVSHSVENLLARHLNLPENANPCTIDKSINFGDTAHKSNTNNVDHKHKNRGNINIETSNINNQNNKHNLVNKSNTSQNQNTRITRDDSITNFHQDVQFQNPQFEDDLIEAEIETLLEVEKELSSGNGNIYTNVVNKAAMPHTENKNDIQLNCSLELEDELFNSFEIDEHLVKIEETYHTSQNMTIKNVLDNIKNKKYGKYKVHAKFKSVVQKMTVKNNKWSVQISITDDKDDLAVYIHTDIVSDITGFTSEEAVHLKQQVEKKNTNAVQTIVQALDRLKNKLAELNGLLEIEYSRIEEAPTIIALL